MYTRTPPPQRNSSGVTAKQDTARPSLYDDRSIPMLIPKDYHGEMLRTVPASMQKPDEEPVCTEACAENESSAPAAVSEYRVQTPPEEPNGRHSTSLIGGIYDLLLGDNSAEEETLLLLGIALLLLWGHLDRGGLFDRDAWDSDDLALILIGYLLLS